MDPPRNLNNRFIGDLVSVWSLVERWVSAVSSSFPSDASHHFYLGHCSHVAMIWEETVEPHALQNHFCLSSSRHPLIFLNVFHTQASYQGKTCAKNTSKHWSVCVVFISRGTMGKAVVCSTNNLVAPAFCCRFIFKTWLQRTWKMPCQFR